MRCYLDKEIFHKGNLIQLYSDYGNKREFEALLTPGTGAPDIRSVFRIDTGAGVVRAALHAVGDYDPEKASVRCTFNRLTED